MRKLIASILIMTMACTGAMAQNLPTPAQPQPANSTYVIDNFSPGLIGHSSPYTSVKGEAQDVYNIRYNEEYGSMAKRSALNTYGTCGHSSPVTGLTRYYTSTGNKYTVTSSSTFLDYISDAGACTNLMSGATAGARWNFSTYKNNLIATNGHEYPQKWDGVTQTTADTAGSRSASYLTTQLGAPFTQLAAGAGLTASNWYQYVIAYWDGTNYWYSAARSNPLQMGATNNKQVLLTGIPIGPATTQARYLFRTKGDANVAAVLADNSFYYVTAFNDNITQTYTDSTTDASIGLQAGSIKTAVIQTAGTAYSLGDVLTLTQTGGTSGTVTASNVYSTGNGATITITASGGAIGSGTVVAGGTGYAVGDVVTILQSGGATGRFTVASLTGTAINTITLKTAGTGYTSATALPTQDSGTITAVSLTTAGSGYTAASGVATTGGSGTGATITITTTPSWAIATSNNNSQYGGLAVTPPHGTFPFINQGYFWLANDASGVQYGQSTAYFSSAGDPDYFLATNYFLIRPDDGDAITFINSFLGTLVIGKTNTLSKIYTSASSTTSWSVSQPFTFFGCIAPYSAQATPAGIMYLGRYGVYQFDGQSTNMISDPITDDINDIASFNLANVTSTVYKNEYRMAYTSSETGAATNNRVLILDMVRKDWVKDTENINSWAVFNSSSDFGGLYSGSSNTDGNILAHSTQPTQLIQKYLTDLNAGTFSYTVGTGTQNNPILSLGSTAWSANATAWNSENTSTWQADASPGTWISPIFQINANALYQLFWNSNVPTGTSATIALRTGATTGAVTGAAWSSEFSNPSGSSISAINPNVYIQMRVTLTTNNLGVTPSLFVGDNYMIQLVYSQVGTVYETSVPSSYVSGWLDLVPSSYSFYLTNMPKIVKEIDVYYEGTSGTMNVGLTNLKGDSSTAFTIDLSQNVPAPQAYWGNGNFKMYRWLAGLQGGNNPPVVGDKFLLSFSESGTTPWRIQRVSIIYDVGSYSPYHGS